MRKIISDVGPFCLRLERDRFWTLVRSIISQQISTGAARAIRMRLEELLGQNPKNAKSLLALRHNQLRSVGLSPQKIKYISDLASKIEHGEIKLRTIGHKSDEEIIEELVKIKGIGRWTAQMFLIFSLGRLDVLPLDDLGLKKAVQKQYKLKALPDKKKFLKIASVWRPYASVASWYCWRSLVHPERA